MPAPKSPRKAAISRRLVVDTSVMRAAGGEEATHPVPANTRDTLRAILTVCHRVCVIGDLRHEWKHHQSRFARVWWRQMYGHGKIIDSDPPSSPAILDEIRLSPALTEREIEAVEKDFHLILAALAADSTVLSLDDKMSLIMRKFCANSRTSAGKAVTQVLWINPIIDKAALDEWLVEGKPAQSSWQLGFAAIPRTTQRHSATQTARRGKR